MAIRAPDGANKYMGFRDRSKLFCTGNYFHFSVKSRTDLANLDQFLKPGVQLRFEIEKNSDTLHFSQMLEMMKHLSLKSKTLP